MKKLTLFFTFLMVGVICAFAGNSSTTMTPIMSRATEIVRYVEDEMDMEVVRMEYDILRTKKTTTRVLSSGWTYMIIAFGDYRFKDIDVKVYRNVQGSWQLVDKDNDSSALAIVSITPQYEGEYMIEIVAYSFESGYDVGHYGLIIAHE
ncbi:MAG: hypothetical protein II540_01690 [Paludibacteraceae bacterium]|nr:hypothetical protein [Paludibacteraceae bacterium]